MSKITKFNTIICERLNLTNDKNLNIVTGKKDGYTFLIMPADIYGSSFNLTFSVSKNRARLLEETLDEIKKLSDKIRTIRISNFKISILIKPEVKLAKYVDNFEEVINKTVEYFKANDILNTDEANGEICETNIVNVKGNPLIIGEKTFNEYNTTIKNDIEINPIKENILLGIIGAFAGSLLGFIAIIIIGQLGFIASISGVAMGFATLEGYRLLGKKVDKKGIIISIIVMIVMTYIASRLNFAIYIKREVPGANLWYVFKNMNLLIKYQYINTSSYYGDMALTYFFTALGAFSSIKRKLFVAKNENVIKKLGE